MTAAAPPGLDALRAEAAALDGARSCLVDAGGLRLHVLSYGDDDPARPDVLVLPGITSPAITWDFAARPLAAAARVHVLDLRGRGLSERAPDGAYALADVAADVPAVAAALGLERPLLLGHSFGARVAAAAALAAPRAVGPLLLVDPPLSGPGRDPYPMSLDAFLTQLEQARRGTSAEEVRGFFPRWPQAELELRARWLATCDADAVAETHRGFEAQDFLPDWARLPAPLALVHGAESPVVTAAGAAELAAANAAAELVAIPGAGHMVPWDAFEDFVAAARALVRRLAGADRTDDEGM